MASVQTVDAGLRLTLEAEEAYVLRKMADELRGMLNESTSTDDPVVARLFPSAYEDPTDEATYRDMVGSDLEREKLQALDLVAAAVPDDRLIEVVITGDEIGIWLACLTDIRLAIGTRIEVDEARMAEPFDPADPDAQSLAVLHWLGFVQESLLRALEEEAPRADT